MDIPNRQGKTIDLHVHSHISDGTYSPAGLAQLAKKIGLAAFALTDHDHIAGNAEAQAEAGRLGIGFLPGMELSISWQGRTLHVVCIGFDMENEGFRAFYRRVRSIKEGRIGDIIAGIRRRAQGFTISEELVRPFANGLAIDRYAIMRYLVSLHLYDRVQPLWDRYINPAVSEAGMDIGISPEEAFPAIHAAGGVCSLAHFHKQIGLLGLSREEQEKAILALHEMGLDGMERYYPNYTDEDRAFAAHMIDAHHLLETGGTDFHGGNRLGIELGTGRDGNIAVPAAFFGRIAERVRCCTMPA